MTDGILLAEIATDRNLTRYDTLIIDEAHERSLNIDFILGYLSQLLPRRPDLKVIITSATIDPERFAEHFKDQRTGSPRRSSRYPAAPTRSRSATARSAPRTTRTRTATRSPPSPTRSASLSARARATSSSSCPASRRSATPPTRSRAGPGSTSCRCTRACRPPSSTGCSRSRPAGACASRRVVLATNVAETSLTVPGIRYVIDPGTARISRYSLRTKVQRLPIEAISQASANQRKGRCGRVADGICIRLYSQEDFESRPEFTDPEIQRTNLASVILQMAAARLGDVRRVPVRRPAGPARDHRRRQAPRGAERAQGRPAHRDGPADGPAARRPAHRPDDHRVGQAGLRPRGPRHRGRAVHPGPARAPVGQPAGRRHRAPPLRAARVRLPGLRRRCGTTSPSGSASCPARRSAACAAPSSSTTCAFASGRTCTASLPRSPAISGSTPRHHHRNECGFTPPCSPACCRRSA